MERMWLLIHALWILWMISGVVVAVFGFWRERLWDMTVFRTGHALGIVATATVPIWNDGRCPITDWESSTGGRALAPFMVRALEALVYWEVSPVVLSLVTAGAAILTVTVYFRHPPTRVTQLHASALKVGRRKPREINRS